MMRIRISCAWSLLLILTFAGIATGQKATGLSGEKVKKVETLITAEMTRQKIPGLSVAVVVNRQLVWSNGYGALDRKTSAPAKSSTVYRLASTTKPITATAVMQLVELGKINLDAPIQKYCPAFPEKQWPVTVAQLLGHLGGIRHYQSDPEFNSTRHYNSIVESLGIFKNDPLKHEPGSKYLYSTYGYSLLGCAVEGASGVTFIDHVREHILKPAGMSNTGLDDAHASIPNRAKGYMKDQSGKIVDAIPADTSSKIPGGGFVGTVEDLARFAIAIQTGRLLKETTLNQMWTRQKTRDGKEINYGLGWGISERSNQKELFHGGSQQGASAFIYMLPEKGAAVVIMMNLEEVEGRVDIVRQIADIALQ
jgi:CubicO group peptidase (beta-lactamase class C family)